MLTGQISEWNRDRGFGYVNHDGRRLYLHIHDFTERNRTPVKGDTVSFVMGVDGEGRPCAQRAILTSGGRLGILHGLLLAGLLAAPGYALYRALDPVKLRYAAAAWAILSSITFLVYAWDKRQAGNRGSREPESHLHFLELIGGWPGAYLAQRKLRHKISKLSYQFVFWLIVAVHQFVAIDFLRGWELLRLATQVFRSH